MDNVYSVYMHECPNGKKYIGITKKNPKERWKNGRAYKNNKHFTAAVNKYGWDNIKHIILHSGLSLEEACEYEEKYIRQYNTIDRKYGYNFTYGGEHHVEFSKETLKKMSESHKGHRLTDECKMKLSIAGKGRKKSEECKAKISKAHIGMKVSYETRKKISEVQKGKKNSPEARRKISSALKLYYSNPENHEKLSESRRGKVSGFCKPKVKVKCVETGIIYESIAEAGRSVGKGKNSKCNIYNACSGRAPSAYGFHWEYVK